jgi:hypothetical protein
VQKQLTQGYVNLAFQAEYIQSGAETANPRLKALFIIARGQRPGVNGNHSILRPEGAG